MFQPTYSGTLNSTGKVRSCFGCPIVGEGCGKRSTLTVRGGGGSQKKKRNKKRLFAHVCQHRSFTGSQILRLFTVFGFWRKHQGTSNSQRGDYAVNGWTCIALNVYIVYHQYILYYIWSWRWEIKQGCIGLRCDILFNDSTGSFALV